MAQQRDSALRRGICTYCVPCVIYTYIDIKINIIFAGNQKEMPHSAKRITRRNTVTIIPTINR